MLRVVAIKNQRAFGIDATQTPSDLSSDGDSPSEEDTSGEDYSRLDFYLEQIIDLDDRLSDLGVSYWVGDGFYAKQKVIDTVTGLGGDLITRLRSDVNLRYLYAGPPKDGSGRPKLYDGKIDWSDPQELARRFDEVGRLPDKPNVRFSRQWPIVPPLGAISESCFWSVPMGNRSLVPQPAPANTPKGPLGTTGWATRLNL